MIGALTGFIFSIPKIISGNNTAPVPTDPKNLNDPSTRNRIEENTNLTQISDWLTKVLIGPGLVQLKEVPKFVVHVERVMGLGIQKNTTISIETAISICAAIILYFVTRGFISGYLVMKLVLTERFATSEKPSNN